MMKRMNKNGDSNVLEYVLTFILVAFLIAVVVVIVDLVQYGDCMDQCREHETHYQCLIGGGPDYPPPMSLLWTA